jgi:Carboxypeptidase regulatory-like domain
MNQKIKLLGIGSLVLTLLSFSDTAFACTCVKAPTPCQAYEQAGAVFIGIPKEVSRNESKDNTGNSGRASRIFRFSVDQAFRGVNNSQVSVITGQGAGDCGYDFKIGEQYLVYAFQDSQKMLSTSICSRTKLVRNADEDLEYIRGLSKASPGGWIFGEVFKTSRTHGGLWPLEGVKVTVVGQGKSVTMVTDKYGKFRASSLPEGNYKVRVSPPDGLTDKSNERDVKVAERGCATVEFWLKADERAK